MYLINSKEAKINKSKLLENEKARMQKGVKIRDFSELQLKVTKEHDDKKEYIGIEYGINPASSPQVIKYLQNLNRAEVNAVICDYKGKISADGDNLAELSLLGYKVADDLLEFRACDSIRKSLNSLADNIDHNRMARPEVKIGITGRWEYSKPAINSIPKELLWDIIAPRDNNKSVWSADIKNQEPTIIAELKNVAELKNRIVSNGDGLYEDMYRWVYEEKAVLTIVNYNNGSDELEDVELSVVEKLSKNEELYSTKRVSTGFMFGGECVKAVVPKCVSCNLGKSLTLSDLPKTVKIYAENLGYVEAPVVWEIEESLLAETKKKPCITVVKGAVQWDFVLDSKIRKEFKTAWLALGYGFQKKSLKASCKLIDADKLWDRFYSIDTLREWKDNSAKKSRKGIKVVETYFGTELHCYGNSASYIARQIMDYEIQGTAADIMELLVAHCDECAPEWLEVYFNRRDELVFLADKSVADEEVKEAIRELMEHKVDNWLPFKVVIEKVSE